MIKVGITGGIGSGKSTLCALLSELGAPLYIADDRAKQLMSQSEAIREAICSEFGAEAYVEGSLNRQYLAREVFSSPEKLRRLNAIVHPEVIADFRAWAEAQTAPYVIFESAILFSAGLKSQVDISVAVLAPEELRVERASQRDGVDSDAIRQRIRNQMSDEELVELADYSIVNIQMEELRQSAERLDKIFRYDSSKR